MDCLVRLLLIQSDFMLIGGTWVIDHSCVTGSIVARSSLDLMNCSDINELTQVEN